MRWIAIGLIAASAGLSLLGSCQPADTAPMLQRLDSLDRFIRMADENLAIDPDKLQLRIDSMERRIGVIDTIFPNIAQRRDEVSVAYNTYVASLIIFKRYVSFFPALLYDNRQLREESDSLRKMLESGDKNQIATAEGKLEEFHQKVMQHYLKTKQLARDYINVIRPFKRKQKIIDHMYNEIKQVDLSK